MPVYNHPVNLSVVVFFKNKGTHFFVCDWFFISLLNWWVQSMCCSFIQIHISSDSCILGNMTVQGDKKINKILISRFRSRFISVLFYEKTISITLKVIPKTQTYRSSYRYLLTTTITKILRLQSTIINSEKNEIRCC